MCDYRCFGAGREVGSLTGPGRNAPVEAAVEAAAEAGVEVE